MRTNLKKNEKKHCRMHCQMERIEFYHKYIACEKINSRLSCHPFFYTIFTPFLPKFHHLPLLSKFRLFNSNFRWCIFSVLFWPMSIFWHVNFLPSTTKASRSWILSIDLESSHMSTPVHAQSISSLNTLLSNPPQYPRNPTHQVHEPLVLYIVRVPGSKGERAAQEQELC